MFHYCMVKRDFRLRHLTNLLVMQMTKDNKRNAKPQE